jgi:hypothetical protein
MSVAEFGARLRDVLDQIARQRLTLAAAASSLADVSARMNTVVTGSGHALTSQALTQIAASIERLHETDRLLAGSAIALVEYGNIVGINLPSPSASRLTTSSAQPTSASTPGADPTATEPAETLPSWLAEAADEVPKRQAKDPTSGVALIGGRRIPMRSGREPDAAADLKPAYKLIATTTDHLEAKLAARMRREQVTEAAVLANNPPCEYEPYGCERILSRLLPVGARLTVYVRDDNGQVRLWRTYTGNGKAIA